MKLYISFDMEGVSGIVDWAQCTVDSPGYAMGVSLTLAEINAAIEGALAQGVTEVVVNDSHSTMRNLDPSALVGKATYISGSHKPFYMMQGLDSSFDLVFFIGYHGAISEEPSVLSHTYNPSVFTKVLLNGIEVGESGINALVALGHRVPIALISGDTPTRTQAERLMPDIISVVVKDSLTRFGGSHTHPEVAREMLRSGAARAVSSVKSFGLPRIELPATLCMEFMTSDLAELATWIKGVKRTDIRSAVIEGDDPIEIYRSFVGVSYLTRQAQGR